MYYLPIEHAGRVHYSTRTFMFTLSFYSIRPSLICSSCFSSFPPSSVSCHLNIFLLFFGISLLSSNSTINVQPHSESIRPNNIIIICAAFNFEVYFFLLPQKMVSLMRTLRSMRRVGVREWWRQLQYIGDAKSGTFVGQDQYVSVPFCPMRGVHLRFDRFGNRYFQNLNEHEEIPGELLSISLWCSAYIVQVVTDGWTLLKCDDLVLLAVPN
jgi:hypothetical protein